MQVSLTSCIKKVPSFTKYRWILMFKKNNWRAVEEVKKEREVIEEKRWQLLLAIGKEVWLKKFLRWCVERMWEGEWRSFNSENPPNVIGERVFTKIYSIQFGKNNTYILSKSRITRIPTSRTRGLKLTICALLWRAAISVRLLFTNG